MFCQITRHILENHDMWKRAIAAEEEAERGDAIREEAAEPASKGEESVDGRLDDREEVPTVEEEEHLQSGGKEEEPESYDDL